MKKPRLGFSRDIYEILEEHGPMAYHSIRRHLRNKGSEMNAKQVRTAVNNLMGRKYIQRSQGDVRRYEIRNKQPDLKSEMTAKYEANNLLFGTNNKERLRIDAQDRTAVNDLMERKYKEWKLSGPIQTPSPVEKTPEREEIRPTEGLFGMNLKDSAIVWIIAVITSALTTTILENL